VLARVVRNGLVEAAHDGAVPVIDGTGHRVASCGDLTRPFFLRSASKPFQATVAQESGADLSAQQMALACASHGGQPVHVAIVRDGSPRAVGVGMVAALDQLGLLGRPARDGLAAVARPPVLGGGVPQGEVEPVLELAW